MCVRMAASASAGSPLHDRVHDRLCSTRVCRGTPAFGDPREPVALARAGEQDPGDVLGEAIARLLHHREVEVEIRLVVGVEVVGMRTVSRDMPRGARRRARGSAARRRRRTSTPRGCATIESSSSTPSDVSWSTSAESTTGSRMFHEAGGLRRGAAALRHRDEALLLDALHRLADDRAADAEVRAEVALGRKRPRPGATSPVTIAPTRSSNRRPLRGGPPGCGRSAGARKERLPGRGVGSLIWSV